MKLHQLFSLNSTDLLNRGSEVQQLLEKQMEQDVSSICFDARQVKLNSVFIAIKGIENDGHDYIEQAIQNGAVALVVENKSKIPPAVQNMQSLYVLEVPDTRKALNMLAAKFYNFPSQDLFCFGVTGTNGKTSITYILEHILNDHKKNMGVIGTINQRVGSKIWPTSMTTPDPVTLQSRLRDFINEGALAVALEVSSHALEQQRVQSVHFNTVIFTNLTLDHLDYHKTMQNYFIAKQKLFTDMMWLSLKTPKFAVINTDDVYGRRLKVAEDVYAWTYGKGESDFQFKILNMNFNETEFEINTSIESVKVVLPVCGEHSVYNIVASCVAALSIGINITQSLNSLKTFAGVPGRMQKVESSSKKAVLIDYAHTPDALENVLKSVQKIRKDSKLNGKVITVFGCGGDRDKTKRPIMGNVASKLSDHVIITSDNPRTENPQDIIRDIIQGLPTNRENYQIEVKRERAIAMAIEAAQDDDVILIAGKGHEDYQIIGTEKINFSDYVVAKSFLG